MRLARPSSRLGFYGEFHFVAELYAAFGEEFDAVVGKHVVRGGNHHAAVQPQGAGEIGNAGGGQGAGLHHVYAGGGEPRHQCGFKHIA